MEREERHFDREREKDAPERERRKNEIVRERSPRREFDDVESARRRRAARVDVHRDDRQQHKDRTRERVEEKLDRRVERAVFSVTPDRDQKVHRHQTQFPENIEQEKVERDEDADHSCFEQQEHKEKFARAFVNRLGGIVQRERRQQRREPDERHTQAVNADVIADVDRLNPDVRFFELHFRVVRIEHAEPDERCNRERNQTPQNRKPFDRRVRFFALGEQERNHRTQERNRD